VEHTHHWPSSALHASAISNVRGDASEGNGILDAAVSPRLQATDDNEAFFIMHATAEPAKLEA
jgi:hypothetical protein